MRGRGGVLPGVMVLEGGQPEVLGQPVQHVGLRRRVVGLGEFLGAEVLEFWDLPPIVSVAWVALPDRRQVAGEHLPRLMRSAAFALLGHAEDESRTDWRERADGPPGRSFARGTPAIARPYAGQHTHRVSVT